MDRAPVVSELAYKRCRTKPPKPDGEAAIADYCTSWLAARGFEVNRLEDQPGRPSLVAIARGRSGGRTLMLNGHLDTVSTADYDGDPLRPEIRDGNVYGRGAFDMKGGIAAMMVAADRAVSSGSLTGDVIVALVADEEYSSQGTAEVLRSYTADAAIITEPSNLEVTLAHKGFIWFEVEIHGLAAHGSRPDLGIDAIVKTGPFLVALEKYGQELMAGPSHPRLGTGTVHASMIHGGEEPSTYPAHCHVTLERRTVPGETTEIVESQLRSLLNDLARTVPRFRYNLTRGVTREPFEADRESPIVRTVLRRTRQVLGYPPVERAEPFWTDAALLHEAGVPGLLIGVDGGGAHAATEWATIDSVQRLTTILTATILDFCS